VHQFPKKDIPEIAQWFTHKRGESANSAVMELMKGESQGIARGRESTNRAKILKKGLMTTRQELRFPRISKNMTGADKMMCDKMR